jgi:hypothetical protein
VAKSNTIAAIAIVLKDMIIIEFIFYNDIEPWYLKDRNAVPCSINAVNMPHIYHSLFRYDFFTRDRQRWSVAVIGLFVAALARWNIRK